MEEKKEKTGNTAVGICLFVIALLLVVIVLFFYNYNNQKNELESKSAKLEKTITEKDEKINELNDKMSKISDVIGTDEGKAETENNNSTTKELDKDSELVKKLYNIIIKDNEKFDLYDTDNGIAKFSFYRDNKIIYNDLKDIEKVLSILNSTDKEDFEENVNIKNLDLKLYQDTYKNYNVKIPKTETASVYSNISKTAKRIFCENANIENKSYNILSGIVEYYDDSYYIYNIEGGGLGNTQFGYSEIQKVEQDDNSIYIYDKFMDISFVKAWVEGDKLVYFYNSSDESKEIGTEEYKNYEEWNSENMSKNFEKFFEKYKDKLNTYKHTFKKSKDGTYYWVSTEIYN